MSEDPYILDRLFRSYITASVLENQDERIRILKELRERLWNDSDFVENLADIFARVTLFNIRALTGAQDPEQVANAWAKLSLLIEEQILLADTE